MLSAADNRAPPRPTLLPHFLALSYTALIVYASLHPLTGWRDPGISPFYFLDAAWPRYWTVFDLAINTLAYLPLGFLLALTLHRLPGRWTPAFSALLLGALLSIWYGRRFFVRVALLQRHLIAPIPFADFGLVLIGLWLLTQLSPETVLFGDGDLRHLLEITPAVPYHAHSFFALETGIIVCNTMAIGLIARALLANRSATPIVLSVFFTLALSIRTLAAAVLVNPLNAFAWLTPGSTYGLVIGGVLLSLILLLPSSIRIALAGLALMCGAVLVNITPPNPYSAAALAAWRQGHFLNFNGLTRLTASVWPFLALPYLTLLARRIESNQG